MKDIFTAPFVEEMRKITANMYRQGWDERNGGNISYMLEEDIVAEYIDINNVIRTIPTGFDATELMLKGMIEKPLTQALEKIGDVLSKIPY